MKTDYVDYKGKVAFLRLVINFVSHDERFRKFTGTSLPVFAEAVSLIEKEKVIIEQGVVEKDLERINGCISNVKIIIKEIAGSDGVNDFVKASAPELIHIFLSTVETCILILQNMEYMKYDGIKPLKVNVNIISSKGYGLIKTRENMRDLDWLDELCLNIEYNRSTAVFLEGLRFKQIEKRREVQNQTLHYRFLAFFGLTGLFSNKKGK